MAVPPRLMVEGPNPSCAFMELGQFYVDTNMYLIGT